MKKATLYFASSMFNYRDKSSNILLVEQLEKMNHKVFLPQRDGFVFQNLLLQLQQHLPSENALSAVQIIIYLLDMGVFLKHSDVVLGMIDEPPDIGVIVEMTSGRFLSKIILGIRTDAQTPFGSISDDFKGVNFFLPFQCDAYLFQNFQATSSSHLQTEIKSLCTQISQTIEQIENNLDTMDENQQLSRIPKNISDVFQKADLLFSGISVYNSRDSIQIICNRFLKYQQELMTIRPQVRTLLNDK